MADIRWISEIKAKVRAHIFLSRAAGMIPVLRVRSGGRVDEDLAWLGTRIRETQLGIRTRAHETQEHLLGREADT